MSESAVAAPVSSPSAPPSSAPSAPTSSHDVAASVVATAEAEGAASGDDAGEEAPSAPLRADPTTLQETPPAPTRAELSEAAKFLVAKGHKWGKRPDGKTDLAFLPASTVEKMLDEYSGTKAKSWEQERTTLSTRAQRVQEVEAAVEALRASVQGDPRAHLEELARINPAFRTFLQTPTAPAAPAAAGDDPMPQPNYPLGDGKFTYDLEGLQKRDEWVKRQIARELEAKIEERFKPIAEREQAERQRQQQEATQREVQARVGTQLQAAQAWPLFGPLAADGSLTEVQAAVLAELQKDSAEAMATGTRPTLSLEGAYIRVTSARVAETDAQTRERLLKEIQGAPRGTATTRQSPDTPKAAGPRSSRDIAQAVVNRLENLV